jgi:hypothetical protein
MNGNGSSGFRKEMAGPHSNGGRTVSREKGLQNARKEAIVAIKSIESTKDSPVLQIPSCRTREHPRAMKLKKILFLSATFLLWMGCSKPDVPSAVAPENVWTPERVAQDPDGYLVWALKETETLVAKLENTLTELTKSRNEYELRLAENAKAVKEARAAFDTLKAAYVQNENNPNAWPLRIHKKMLDKEQVMAEIITSRNVLDGLMFDQESFRKLHEKVQGDILGLEQHVSKVRVNQATLSQKIEIAKLNKSSIDATELWKENHIITQAAIAVTQQDSIQGAPSLFDATRKPVAQDEFTNAMRD